MREELWPKAPPRETLADPYWGEALPLPSL
ncbi:hypothetical protein LEMLEM_LOCUS10565 [Lemmus lemmus]